MTWTKNFRLILLHCQVLDISGNGMGDVGARLLAKALQINTRFGPLSGSVYIREAVKNYLADFFR